MKRKKSFINTKKWEALLEYISIKFGDGVELDLQAVLFLIGVNELGQGYRDFTKEEKVNLLHIAICRLLSTYGYYNFVGKDRDGWPHWTTNQELPRLEIDEQTVLLKEAAILYFSKAGIQF